MNYKVTLPVLLFFSVHVHSAIISVKSRPNEKEGLQKATPFQTQRIYLDDSPDNHNALVASPIKKEINKQLCDQCKHTDLCRVQKDCKHCLQYCKTYEVEEKRDIHFSQEDVGIARDPENDIMRAEDETDRTRVSKIDDDSAETVLMANPFPEEVNSREADEEAVQMVHKPNDDQVDDIRPSPESREAEVRGGRKFQRTHEPRYYALGAINPGLPLKILLRLTGVGKTDGMEKAVILVKSDTPVKVEEDITDNIGDTVFFKIFAKELDKAEKNLGRDKLSAKEMNKLLEVAYEKVKEKSEPKQLHIVGMEENATEDTKNETVGCSKEESETVPFFPLQPPLYRSVSASLPVKPPHSLVVEPDELEDSFESTEEKHSKNPGVIQGDPNMQSRSTSLKTEVNKDKLNHSIRAHEIIDSISDQLKRLENMNIVGSTKTKPHMKGVSRDVEEVEIEQAKTMEHDQGVEEKDPIRKQDDEQSPDGQQMIVNINSGEESDEENEKMRHHHKKNKKNKKMGGGYGSSYGNSYGNSNSYGHGMSYGSAYRQADADINEDSEQTLRKEFVAAQHNDISEEEPEMVRTHNERGKKQKYGSYGASYRSENDNDKDGIQIPDTNIKLDKNKFMAARPDLDAHDGLPEEFHEGIHAHFQKIQEAHRKKQNQGATEVPKNIGTQTVKPPTVHSVEDKTITLDKDISSEETRSNVDVLGTKHKKYKKKGGYYRENDSTASQEDASRESDERIFGNTHKNDEPMVTSETSVPNGSPTVGIHFEPNDLINLQLSNRGLQFDENSFDGEEVRGEGGNLNGSKNKVHNLEDDSVDVMDMERDSRVSSNSKNSHGKHEMKPNGHHTHHSEESNESNESFEKHVHVDTEKHVHVDTNQPVEHNIKDNSQIVDNQSGKDSVNVLHDSNMAHVPLSGRHISNEVLMSQKERILGDKTKLNEDHKSMPGTTLIQIDDQLVDIPKEGHSMFQKGDQPRLAAMEENMSNQESTVALETPLDISNLDPSDGLKINPQVIADQAGQNMGLIVNLNDVSTVRPQFPFKSILPSKLIPNIPVSGSISASAPAFGENNKIEIHIPNFLSSPLNHGIENLEPFPVTEQFLEMTEMPVPENVQAQEFVEAKAPKDSNSIDANNIDKLITPQEQEFLHNFGKIVPAAEKMHLKSDTDVFFMGNGIKLPLKVSQNRDGSIALAVDIEKLCKCKNATCIHRRDRLKQLDNLVGLSNDQIDFETEKVVEKEDRVPSETPSVSEHQDASAPRKSRKVRNHKDYSKFYRNYNKKYHRFHKRSIDDTFKKNILENQPAELKLETPLRKSNSKSDLQNSLVKESNPKGTAINELHDIKDIHKFQQIEKEMEQKLDKLQEDVQRSSKQYDNMLQEGTKNLLQIKGEDQVVKHRIELVNDLLKWMKKMAEGVATFNKSSEEAM